MHNDSWMVYLKSLGHIVLLQVLNHRCPSNKCFFFFFLSASQVCNDIIFIIFNTILHYAYTDIYSAAADLENVCFVSIYIYTYIINCYLKIKIYNYLKHFYN